MSAATTRPVAFDTLREAPLDARPRHARAPLLTPSEAAASGERAVGGKAFGLAGLAGVGVRVPSWRVLPAGVPAERLVALGLDAPVGAELASLAAWYGPDADGRREAARTAAALAPLVAALVPDHDTRAALADAWRALGAGPVAVRSSAVGEDGVRRSFAGQFETVLGVRDAVGLADAVARCWRSAFSAHVLDYRRRGGTLADAAHVAVVVQTLVEGGTSGVLFTADPLTGDATRVWVSACRGLGEGLVSGRCEADEYVVGADGAVLDVQVARAPTQVILVDGATRETPVDAQLVGVRVLDDEALAELAAAGRRIAAHAGAPRDVEWTRADGRLFILQARPLTGVTAATPAPAGLPGRRIVWDNSNIQESYCGVTTPLTFSFASAAYASVYEQTMRALGIPERTIAAHRPLLRNLLGLLRGRVYYNLENWYRGLQLLPGVRRNAADMEAMMGVEEPVDFVVDDAPRGIERVRRAGAALRALAALLSRFATLGRDRDRFLARFDRITGGIDRRALGACDLGTLMATLAVLRDECLTRWTTPIINDFYTMMCVGRLRRLVARADASLVDARMQTLLGGADVAASAGPAMLLLRMAALARADDALARALDTAQPDEALATARAASGDFATALDALYDRYGDRCMGELKLESRPLRDDPAFVVRVLRNYLASAAPHDAADLGERAARARAAAERDVAGALGPVARVRFRRTLGSARQAVHAREAMRLARTRLFGLHRDVYRAVGAHLHARGRLDAADDVLYLTTTEIDEYWEGRAPSAGLAALARVRRAEYAAYAREPALPNRLTTCGAPGEAVPAAAPARDRGPANARVLRGLGCSPGVAEGRVRIVTSADDDLALAGHVLVAPRTDPGWAPLFPSAAAIVVERGSLLSHSAVLARELELPAVVAIPGVLETLRDGERVRVDGTAGTVERLEAP